MKVRDKHLRQRIFQTEDGEFPDIEFFSSRLIVPVNQTIWNATLKDFKIRGVPKEVSIPLSITYQGGEYRTKGVIVIKLTKH